MNTDIKHNQDKQRFEINQDGMTAYISYVLNNHQINYNHTIVPDALGGQGMGTELVKYALAYARVNHLQVIPSCSFVAHLIQKHEVYQDLLVASS